MTKKSSWLHELHQKAKSGAVSEKDDQEIREMMKIPNDDVSVEDVTFKNYKNYF